MRKNLDNIIQQNDATPSEINQITNDISKMFEKASLDTFGTQKAKNHERPNIKQPWFNIDCKKTRNLYNKTRRAYNKYKTPFHKNLLKNISKQYKDILRKSQNKFNSDRIIKIKSLKNAKPKQYWQIINNKPKEDNVTAPLTDFYQYFKEINENMLENEDQIENFTEINNNLDENDINEDINKPISEQEVRQAIKNLKNSKSPGIDNVVNEQMKSSINIMLPIYVKLFNFIFNKGIIPESWTIGLIKPIYKNKGDPKRPENYRPISLLSCFGKLFTYILNSRLNAYAEKSNLINGVQAGFRKHHSTVDNLFVLKSLIDLAQSSKKKLFCCFIDFKQAFDSVWRVGLWQKLQNEKINGKCFNVIYNLYDNIKSKVVTNEGSSEYFNCLAGVRQGENLSPFLFSIFLNDLEGFLNSHNINGIERETMADDINIYLKLFVLLYADDTVLFSENQMEFQITLNKFKDYCDLWKLKLNVEKTKILIFSKGNPRQNYNFKIGENDVEIVDNYKYLGLYFSRSGSFYKTKIYIAEQANKALFALLRKIKRLALPFEIQIDLFNKTVKPILLYGSEIWGFGNLDILERVQLKFYKYIFNLKRSTPTYMIYGELGITPLSVDIQNKTISFWTKLIENIQPVNNTTQKISSTMYMLIQDLHEKNQTKSPWLENIKNILCTTGFSGIWYSQSFCNAKWLIKSSYQKLKDIFIQKWYSEIDRTSGTNIYKIFKTQFKQSEYIKILSTYQCKKLIAFLTRNHRLPVEVGRWRSIPSNERKCTHCTDDIGDEFHYLFQCTIFQEDRRKYLKTHLYTRPNTLKLQQILSSENTQELKKLSIFVEKIMKTINTA